jgi:hypothetical protein
MDLHRKLALVIFAVSIDRPANPDNFFNWRIWLPIAIHTARKWSGDVHNSAQEKENTIYNVSCSFNGAGKKIPVKDPELYNCVNF